jgi:hypothetical protein
VKISEYVSYLEKLREHHGDLEVCTMATNGSRVDASAPHLAAAKIPTHRERNSKFWYSGDGPEAKGHLVVRI